MEPKKNRKGFSPLALITFVCVFALSGGDSISSTQRSSCPTESLALSGGWEETVENEETQTTRTISLNSPEYDEALGLEIAYAIPLELLIAAEVAVEMEGSIFSPGANITVEKNLADEKLIISVQASDCSGVSAVGLAMKVKISNLPTGSTDLVSDGGDVILVIVSNI